MTTATATTEVVRDELAHVPLDMIVPASTNCRTDAGDIEDMARSIRMHGVLTPLKLRRLPDGRYEIVHGSRRYLGALRAGRQDVPAIIADVLTEVERISQQLAENTDRLALPELDQIRAVQQLFELGVTDEEAIERTGGEPAQIVAMRRIAQLPPSATELIAEGTLTFAEAAELAAIEDPEVVDEVLIKMGDGYNVASAVRSARDNVRSRRLETEARAKLERQGATIIEAPLTYDFPASSKTRQLGTGYHDIHMTVKEHRKHLCHAAYLNRWPQSSKDAIVYVCTDVSRHAQQPDANVPEQFTLSDEDRKRERAAKRAVKKAWRQSHGPRRAVAAQVLADLDAGETATRLAGECLRGIQHAQAAVAAILLGQPDLSEHQALTWLREQVTTADPEHRLRIAVAVLMARAEVAFGKDNGDWHQRDNVLAHFRMLEGHQYSLDDGERAQLERGFSIRALDEPSDPFGEAGFDDEAHAGPDAGEAGDEEAPDSPE